MSLQFEDKSHIGGRVPRSIQRPRVRRGEGLDASGLTLPVAHPMIKKQTKGGLKTENMQIFSFVGIVWLFHIYATEACFTLNLSYVGSLAYTNEEQKS